MDSKTYARGSFPTDDEIAAAARPRGPSCLGLTLKEWASLIVALLILYVVLALMFWGLLYAAEEIRDDSYIELPDRFFGDFSKVERYLTNNEGQDVFKGDNNPTDGQEGDERRRVNYPEGCQKVNADGDEVEDGEEPTLLQCGNDRGQKHQWAIFPWVSVIGYVGDTCEGQTFTTLDADTTSLRFATQEGEAIDGVCVNGRPKSE